MNEMKYRIDSFVVSIALAVVPCRLEPNGSLLFQPPAGENGSRPPTWRP